MTFTSVLLNVLRKSVARSQSRQSLGRVLARHDDHLLDDIGLTRHAAERLLAEPLLTHPENTQRSLTLAATTGAGSFRWATSGSSQPM